VSKVKIISLIIVLTIGLLILTGCANKISSGEVYQKEFKEAHSVVRVIPLITSNGKTTHTTMIPYIYHYPDRYIIYIKKFEDNEWKTASYYTTKEVYDSINIEDQFEYVKDRDLTEEPYTREREW